MYDGELVVETEAVARKVITAMSDIGINSVEEVMSFKKDRINRETPADQAKPVMTLMLGVDQNLENHRNSMAASNGSKETIKDDFPNDINSFLSQIPSKIVKELDEVSFDCPECNDRFATEINLRTHLADFHMILRCKECGLQVKGNNNLVKHTVANHPLYPDLGLGKSISTSPTCDICKESFGRNDCGM